MMDQAEKLRQAIDSLKMKQSSLQSEIAVPAVAKTAKVITVTSGKGGVGKTNITLNMAIALSEMGYRVVILDADFGLANIDVLLGLAPRFTLVDVVQNRKSILEVITEGPCNIKFISGGSGVEELVKLDKDQVDRFIKNIGILDRLFDIVLIDTGAGLSENVMSFVMSADEVLLVTTPEPTSITDAYAMIKMISNRDRRKVIRLIINRAESAREANDIFSKLSLVAEKFLSIKLHPLGYVLEDDYVTKAVKRQQPFSIVYSKSNASRNIKAISERIMNSGADGINNESGTGIRSFINRLINIKKPN